MIQGHEAKFLACSSFTQKLHLKLHAFLMMNFLVTALLCLQSSNMNYNKLFASRPRTGESRYSLKVFVLVLFMTALLILMHKAIH